MERKNKHKKNEFKKVACCLLAMGMLVVQPEFIHAAEKPAPAEEVFDQETVDKLVQKAREEVKKEALKRNVKARNGIMNFGVHPEYKGLILVTTDAFKGLIPTGHAAIVWNKKVVYEAVKKGVSEGANDWEQSKDEFYGVQVKDATAQQDQQVARFCKAQVGKPYNLNYYEVATRKKFYCSQLVWADFLDKTGINLNEPDFGKAIHPMELVNTDKTRTVCYFMK